jgi:hypothetical protein
VREEPLLLALGQLALTDLILYFLRLLLLGVAKEGNTGTQQVQRGQAEVLVGAVVLETGAEPVVVALVILLILLLRKEVMAVLVESPVQVVGVALLRLVVMDQLMVVMAVMEQHLLFQVHL